ncbi:MAG: hypothetical protein ACKVKF_19000 [Rhodobacterales bacterium]|nr:hypothetical protein [Puniceibacterium antarcticum]
MRDAVLRRFVRGPSPWQVVCTVIALGSCILFFGDINGNTAETDLAMFIRTYDDSDQVDFLLSRVDQWF